MRLCAQLSVNWKFFHSKLNTHTTFEEKRMPWNFHKRSQIFFKITAIIYLDKPERPSKDTFAAQMEFEII